MSPKLDVLIATHNGGQRLRTALESLTRVVAPASGWRLIIVDNASTDDTSVILDRYRDRLPLEIIQEERRGKNVALNSAIPILKAPLVAFTDDDVALPEDWLLQFESAADRLPEYSIFAGRVVAKWPGDKVPVDIVESIPLGPAFAVHPPDLEEGEIVPEYVWGPNFCVRRSLFDEGHRFDTKWGPAAGIYVMGGETEFAVRMSGYGQKCCYLPNVVVQHQIRKAQLTLGWLSRRARRFGRSVAKRTLNESMEGPGTEVPFMFGIPRWYFSDVLRQASRLAAGSVTRNRRLVLEALWNMNYRLAVIRELLRARQADSSNNCM